ncbi:hypothetical protein ACJJTC_004923 [Scirpophaga incertulas]
MGEPPDPGGTYPPKQKNVEASQAVQTPMDVLINVLESSIDTDCSISESSKLKRKRVSRGVCTACNKRTRKTGSKVFNSSDCQCTQNKEAELMSSPVAPLNGQLVLNKDIERKNEGGDEFSTKLDMCLTDGIVKTGTIFI